MKISKKTVRQISANLSGGCCIGQGTVFLISPLYSGNIKMLSLGVIFLIVGCLAIFTSEY